MKSTTEQYTFTDGDNIVRIQAKDYDEAQWLLSEEVGDDEAANYVYRGEY